jgi:transcriptional regulator with XRE-family HTH domain
MEDFSTRLNIIMKRYDLSAAQLAEKLNIQRSSISHLLSGRNKPRFDFLRKLVEVFPDIDIKWLLTGKESEPPHPAEPEPKGNTDKNTSYNRHTGDNGKNKDVLKELIKIYDDGTFEVLKPRNN